MDLTPEQARTLRDAVRSRMNYLHAVRNRMYQLGVREGDQLFDLFGEAEQALTRLATELHNRLIVVGGRRPWEPSADDDGAVGPAVPPQLGEDGRE
jgi:hypothetical protein